MNEAAKSTVLYREKQIGASRGQFNEAFDRGALQ